MHKRFAPILDFPTVTKGIGHACTFSKLFHSNATKNVDDLLLPIIILTVLMTKISYTRSCYATDSPAELGEIICEVGALTLITLSIIFNSVREALDSTQPIQS